MPLTNFLRRALSTGFFLLGTLPAVAFPAGLQTIALTGQSAPGGPPGALFQEFGLAQINNVGNLVLQMFVETQAGEFLERT